MHSMIKPLRSKNTIVPLEKVFEALKEFEITPEEQAELEKEKVQQDSQNAEESKKAPSNVRDKGDFLLLENIVCKDADGNIFEQYDALEVRKNIFWGKRNPNLFTLYEAAVYCDTLGLFLPSFALSCNILAALYHGKSDPEIAKVLNQYNKHSLRYGHGWLVVNTLIDWKREKIIHYPTESDFASNGGNQNVNKGRKRKEFPFSNEDISDMLLEEALKVEPFRVFIQNFTGLQDPSILIEMGKYYGKEGKVWVSSMNETRAVWLGCNANNFYVAAYYHPGISNAARGVRERSE